MCKGYAQEEGIEYGEKLSPIYRLEWVRTLLAYVVFKGLKVYQMDIKSAFLNGILEEEVYIDQPESFIDPNKRDMVCKLNTTLYVLKQSHREWHKRVHRYLVKIDFQRTNDNNSLYIK